MICVWKKISKQLFTVGSAGFFGDFYCDSLVIGVRCRINLIF